MVAALVAAPAYALTAPTALAATTVPTAAPSITSSVDFDYFADKYPALASKRGNTVFESVTIERFKYLLRFKAGNYAFLIGDPTNATTQAEIGYIDDVAKGLGITKIYNFNPRIDGAKLNVFDWTELSSELTGAGLTYWKQEGPAATTGGTLLDLINGDSPAPKFVRDADGKVTAPYLVVLNKDRVDSGGKADRVVASLSDTKTAADLDTTAKVNAYKAQVSAVLSAAPLSVSTQFDFYKDEVNRRHTATYTDATKYGGAILDDADNTDGWRIQSLTYPETIDLLSNPAYASSDVPLLFGGTWCHNTRAVIKYVNEFAQESGVKTVYNLDYSLFSTSNGGTNYDHIRTSGTPTVTDGKLLAPGQLYGDLFNTYLYNAVAEYAAAGEAGASPNLYYPGGDTTKTLQSARRLQVPALLVYNKNHKDALGNPAPVVDQAIRYNDNGTYTEYMTENWYVAGRNLPNTADTTLTGTLAAGGNALTNARDFAREGIDEYQQVLGSLATDRHTSTTTATVAGTESSDLVPGTTPTLNVTVASATFKPFITFNKNAASTDQSVGTGSPRGYVVVLDQDGDQVGSPVALTRDGAPVSITLPAITSDQVGDTWKVEYLGRGYSIATSSADLRVGKRSDVTLTGATSTQAGTAVTYTATVTAGATGTVSLEGLPSGTVTSTIADGKATLTVPSTVNAGTYTVKASYSGDDQYASSVSAPITLTVKQLAAKATVTAVKSSTYGKAVKVTVKVTDATGKAATGKVTLTGAGAAQSATLSSAGQAVVTLPASLAVKSYTLKAAYAGSTNVAATTATTALKVTKGKVKKVATKVTKASTSKKKGKATVTVTTVKGLAKATGKVTVTIKKGKKSVKAKGTVKAGKATVTLPKLAKGTWKVTVKYAGTTTYAAANAKAVKVKVKK